MRGAYFTPGYGRCPTSASVEVNVHVKIIPPNRAWRKVVIRSEAAPGAHIRGFGAGSRFGLGRPWGPLLSHGVALVVVFVAAQAFLKRCVRDASPRSV